MTDQHNENVASQKNPSTPTAYQPIADQTRRKIVVTQTDQNNKSSPLRNMGCVLPISSLFARRGSIPGWIAATSRLLGCGVQRKSSGSLLSRPPLLRLLASDAITG
jgi:hypothetical protein